MPLISVGDRLPPFRLPKAGGGPPVAYNSFLRRRRIIVLTLGSEATASEKQMRAWLGEARNKAAQLAERDMTVLVVAKEPDEAREAQKLPAPLVLLRDSDGAVTRQLGGANAFYLVGKDTGVKRAERAPVSLSELFALIDSMPMRRQEMHDRKSE